MLYARFPEIRNDDRDHAHYLDPQNRARAEVGSPAIVWDAELQAQAERLAEYLAQKEGCAVRRMKEVSGGVNLRWAAESWGVPAEAESAVAEWVREKAHYRLEAFPAGCAEGRDCTHYTQVVWKKTERVGSQGRTCCFGVRGRKGENGGSDGEGKGGGGNRDNRQDREGRRGDDGTWPLVHAHL
ncbi:unnamed protein product [Closterium sp. NIES-65]|nr:unnamed protein product [Closterium sp. NIES-65]